MIAGPHATLSIDYIGDQLEVYGGHINCAQCGVYVSGWRTLIIIGTYFLLNPGVVAVHAHDGSGPIIIKSYFDAALQANCRAVWLDDINASINGVYDLDITYAGFMNEPVLLTGGTNNGFTRGSGNGSAFHHILLDQTGLLANEFDFVCAGSRLSSNFAKPQFDYNGVLNVTPGMFSQPIFLTGPDPVTLPDPTTVIGAEVLIANAWISDAVISANGVNTFPPSSILPSNTVVHLKATPGLWIVVS